MAYIYILELSNNKYYIGRSKNPKSRITKHYNREGSAWTKIHKPILTIDVFKEKSKFDEDFVTLQYMEKYGIQKVRGGTFSQVKLKKEEIYFINKMLNSKSNRCYKCGGTNHYINECYLNSEFFNDDSYDFDNDIRTLVNNQDENQDGDEDEEEIEEHIFDNYPYLNIIKNSFDHCWGSLYYIFNNFKNRLSCLKSYHYTDIDEYLEDHYHTEIDSEDEDNNQINNQPKPIKNDNDDNNNNNDNNDNNQPQSIKNNNELENIKNKPKNIKNKQNNKFTFGRYKGKTYDEVILKEPNYIKWCLRQPKPSKGLKLFINYYNSEPKYTSLIKKNN